MESGPADDAQGPSKNEQSHVAQAWASFNAQGGLIKIVIGSVTAAFAATLTALLMALPGVVSSWLDQPDDANAAADVSQTTPAPAAAAPTTAAVSVPAAPASNQTTIAEQDRDPIKIESLRMRLDDSFYFLDIAVAPPSTPVIIDHIGIAKAYLGLPCTGGGPPVVELLTDSALVQETDGELTTLRFEQAEPGIEGTTPIEAVIAQCSDPDFHRVSFSPQIAVDAGKPAQFVAKIPRQPISAESFKEPFALLESYGRPGDIDQELHVAIATSAGECAWYVADLSDISLPPIEPPRFDPVDVGVCPE